MAIQIQARRPDAEYDSFPGAACYANQSAADGCVGGVQDLGGGKLQLAPDTSANFNVEYVRSIGSNLELTAQIDVNYTDDILLANDNDPHPAQTQDAFTKVDARIFLGSLESGWRVGIVGKNLSDKITQSWANDLPIVSNNNYFAHIDRPRSIAIQVSWDF